ncbi:MAG TPA: beta-propeller fold lactonase family protein [Steroidobacteraceae bacterium]
MILSGCGGGEEAPIYYTVGGSVSGLSGSGLILQDNGGDNLAVTGNGTFVFKTAVPTASAYNIAVATQPSNPIQNCVVASGSGSVAAANVTGAAVTCTTLYTIGGSISGLSGSGLILQDNGGDNLALTGNGTFVFRTAVPTAAAYNISVATQPSNPTQNCVVANASGSVGAANVTSAALTCTTIYSVGGTTSGLAGSGLVLRLNDGVDLPILGNGSFVFPSGLTSGTAYTIAIKLQPSNPSQLCVLGGASGIIASANVTDPVLTCKTVHRLGGTIQGLSLSRFDTGAVLQNNGGDNLTLLADGSFAFATPITEGSSYNIAMAMQPMMPSRSCNVSNATGTVGTADVTSVVIICSANPAQFVFVANTIGTVNLYGFQGGALAPLETLTTVHGGLQAIAVDPSGQFVYTGSNLGYLEGYRLDPVGGTLLPLAGSPLVDQATPQAVAVDPTSRFLFVANTYGGATSQGSVSAYTIDAQSGALAEIPGSPYTLEYHPAALTVDPTGRFLFVPSQGPTSGQVNVSTFAIDQNTGALSQVIGSPVTVPGGVPTAIAYQARYVYVQTRNLSPAAPTAAITGFSINGTNGVLTALPGAITAPDVPFSMASSPTGGYLYATSFNQPANPGSISVYVAQSAGTISEISGSPYQSTVFPTAVVVDPVLQHLFVTSESGGSVSTDGALYMYDFDSSTGVISNRSAAVTAGDYPYAIAIY